ncbi:HET-domain-containing protein [Amniculicola lignicola CBS 123094]|uniref:HET-domain-containing protein n=1 Tax=Amniculicola lignicola CBS 123094 TaxID=1392246 RepID=A0A6A5X3P6_9PLEO|nr:HET-domain-containing protein [Amniculicola lignicola CBS 123094]
MEEGQEGPNSIFYVPGMPSETRPDFRLYTDGDGSISFSEWMQKVRDLGFQGSSISFAVTPRPQDIRRVPLPPPEEKEISGGGVAMAVAKFYRIKCNYCWAIVCEAERETGFDLAEIEGAAEKGCSTCLAICAGIRHFADMIFPRYNTKKIRVRQTMKAKSKLLSDTEAMVVSFDEFNGESFTLTFSDEVTEGAKHLPWNRSRVANERKRIMDTSSYESIRQIKEWLQTCSEEHEYCAVPTESELPTRVLDISNKRAKLIETHGMRAPYVSLSHCWGRKPIIRLLLSNIDKMKKGIPWDELSKTFQDSIVVAWKLGFRYIWIDALCILQDSSEDWEYHASRMAQIFTDSQLTISASSSADGAGGCFSSRLNDPWTLLSTGRQIRNPNLWLPYMQKGRDREGCMKTFNIRLKSPHGLYSHRQPKEPLLNRAWVFQEQILSSRNVHFASGELYFECKSYVACECSGWTARSLSYHWETRWRKSHAILQGQLHFPLPAAATHNQSEDLSKPNLIPRRAAEFEAYRALIESYTSLDITNVHDRLPALSGIMSSRKDTYLGGLWRSILLESLHWYPLPKSHSSRGSSMAYRPARYRAPTWSWTSIESPIRFLETNFYFSNFPTKPVARILEASVTPEGLDPRGRVKDGMLKLSVPLAEAVVRALVVKERDELWNEKMAKERAKIEPDAFDPSFIAELHSKRPVETYAVLAVATAQGGDDSTHGLGQGPIDVECSLDVPLCLARTDPAEIKVGEIVMVVILSTETCLVLKPVLEKPGHYRRVGLLHLPEKGTFRWAKSPIYII